jgi:hypothetical protein
MPMVRGSKKILSPCINLKCLFYLVVTGTYIWMTICLFFEELLGDFLRIIYPTCWSFYLFTTLSK